MSGGVDSSVAALLLKQQGYRVIGCFMKNWEEKDSKGACRASIDYEDVIRVCEHLGISYYSVNFVQKYWDRVFTVFIEDVKKGFTPNPDILCNKEIKFKAFLEKAREMGGDYLATGHYCRIREEDGEYQLMRGVDRNKDQSYFLYTIKSQKLKNVLFPLGEMTKSQVRRIAREHRLPTSEKKDSTGICFIGKRDFKTFLNRYIDFAPGHFETTQKQIVGRHDGMPFYTIGQRKGLGIGGPGEAWYVVGKDRERNVVIVEQGADHPALFSRQLAAADLSWVSPKGLSCCPFPCQSKIRYRQSDAACIIQEIDNGSAKVEWASPQRAVTPRQSIVFYDGEVCLGGGIIS